MKNLLTIVILFLLPFGIFSQNSWHVAVDGTPSGNGTIDSPWDLQTALNQPSAILPGDTVFIHGGTYKGGYKSYLTGNKTDRIVVKAFDKSNPPVLDFWEWKLYNIGIDDLPYTLLVYGGYTTYMDIAIVSSNPYHFTLLTGSNPAKMLAFRGFYVYGTHINLINSYVFYQTGEGVAFWASNYGGIQYGTIVGLNGWVSTDRGHGQGSYIQNYPDTLYKHFENNIWLKNCSYGMKIYAQSDKVHNVYVENNIAFMNGAPSWSYDGIKDIEIYTGDYTDEGDGSNVYIRYNSAYQLDSARNATIAANVYGSATNFQTIGNTAVNGLYTFKTHGLEGGSRVDSNFFYNARYSVISFSLSSDGTQTDSGFDSFNHNTYYQKNTTEGFQYVDDSWSTWQSEHPTFDVNSTFTAGEPTSNIVNVYPNEYEQGRAHVAIFNFTGARSQAVDLTSVCSIGDSVVIYDVEHLFGDNALIKTIYSGSAIDFPLNLTSQDSIPEYSDVVHHSPQDFNAYLVLPYSLKLPVVNRGINHIKTKIVIDSLIDNNNAAYTVFFHDLAPYEGVKYRIMVQTKREGPAEDYKVYNDISYDFTFNMLEDFPETGTQDFVVSVMNDSTYTETEFTYTSYRNKEMLHAVIRDDDLMVLNFFNPNSGNDEYGYLYDEAGNLLGDSVYHISVSGVNTIYLKYFYKNEIESIKEQKYKMVVKNSTTGWSDSISVDKTMYDYNALHIFDWTYDNHFDKTVLKYYRGQNYYDTLMLFNSNDELLRVYDTYSYVGDNVYIIDLDSYPTGTYKVILTDDHTSDTAVYVKGTPPTLSITNCGPNPTYGEFTVEFRSEKNGDVNVDVFNADNKSVWQKSVTVAEGTDSVMVDITSEQEGTYMVKLDNGTDSDSCTVTKLDVPEVLSVTSFSPNPTYDIVTFILNSPATVSIDIVVTNSSGEEVKSQTFSAVTGGSNSVEIDLTSLPVGVYTISFNDGTSPIVSSDVTREEKPRELEIISCSPNPTYNSVFVQYYSPAAGSVTVRVVNSSGSEVLTKGHTAIVGDNNSVEVDLTGNATGIYYITLNNGTTTTEPYAVTKQDEVAPSQPLTITDNTKTTYGLAYVNFYSPSDVTVTYEVFNTSGLSVESGNYAAKTGNNTLPLDFSNYLAGNYRLLLNDGNTTAECNIEKLKDIEEDVPFEKVDAKPDVTFDIFTFRFKSPSAGEVLVEVINDVGRVVKKVDKPVVKGLNRAVLNLSDLDPGNYKVKITNGVDEPIWAEVIRQIHL